MSKTNIFRRHNYEVFLLNFNLSDFFCHFLLSISVFELGDDVFMSRFCHYKFRFEDIFIKKI